MVYFTHDYFASSADKNHSLVAAAKIAKSVGVERLVAVNPIELNLYYTEDATQPLQHVEEAQQKALQTNPDRMTILNTNLSFGRNSSYLVQYLAQCVADGKVPKHLASESYRYHPLGADDLTTAINTSFEKLNEAKGKKFNVNGHESATLRDIITVLENSLAKAEGSTKKKYTLPLVEFVEEFFVGITHDRNMIRFAEEFDKLQPSLEASDFFKAFHLQHKNSLEKEYKEKQIQNEELVHPIYSNYKMVSLD